MKIKSLISIFILVHIAMPVLGCSCSYQLHDSIPSELINSVDIYAEVTIMEQFGIPGGHLEWCKKEKRCDQVKVKVKSVFKGGINPGEIMYINQLGAGNCMRAFRKGEKWIILGNLVRSFEYVEKDTSTKYPIPIYNLDESGNFSTSTYSDEEIEYWNQLIKTAPVLYTTQCMTIKK